MNAEGNDSILPLVSMSSWAVRGLCNRGSAKSHRLTPVNAVPSHTHKRNSSMDNATPQTADNDIHKSAKDRSQA